MKKGLQLVEEPDNVGEVDAAVAVAVVHQYQLVASDTSRSPVTQEGFRVALETARRRVLYSQVSRRGTVAVDR